MVSAPSSSPHQSLSRTECSCSGAYRRQPWPLRREHYTDSCIGADKKCWPGEPQDISCYALPASTLPKNVYGPQTDVPGTAAKDSDLGLYLDIRQRYLNSSFLLGTVGTMRAVFKRARETSERKPKLTGS